jgi:hypothetical protein
MMMTLPAKSWHGRRRRRRRRRRSMHAAKKEETSPTELWRCVFTTF